jgi:hypothetical protein
MKGTGTIKPARIFTAVQHTHPGSCSLLRQAGYNSAHVHWPHLYWGTGIDLAVQRAELIAEDHSFTRQTTEQRYDPKKSIAKLLLAQ